MTSSVELRNKGNVMSNFKVTIKIQNKAGSNMLLVKYVAADSKEFAIKEATEKYGGTVLSIKEI
jgi:hypothetical protein